MAEVTYVDPNSTPSYVRLSNPISQPGAPQDRALGWNTASDVAKGATTLADEYVKRNYDQEIHSEMDTLQKEKNEDIDLTTKAVLKGTVTDSEGKDIPLADLLGKKDEEKTPAELTQLDRIMKNLRAAKDHGEYSDSYYRARVDELAKRLRAKYPGQGYRDFIDAKIKGEEGSTANELAASKVKDLNAALRGLNEGKGKIETKILANIHYEDVAKAYPDWKAGKVTDNDMIAMVARNEKIDHDLKNREITNTLEEKDRLKNINNTEAIATGKSAALFSTAMNANISGATGEWKSTNLAIQNLVDREARGETVTDQEKERVIPMMFQSQRKYVADMNSWLDGYDEIEAAKAPKDRRSRRMILGPEKSKKIVEDGMKELTAFREDYANSNFGSLAQGHRIAQARVNDVGNLMMQTFPTYVQTAAANKFGGSEVAKSVSMALLFDTKGGITAEAKAWALVKGLNIIMNPEDLRGTAPEGTTGGSTAGRPLTADLAEAPSKLGKDSGAAAQYLIDTATGYIKDPKTNPEARKRAIDRTFGPGNESMFDHIPNATTTQEGLRVKGKETVFSDLTQKDVVEGAKKSDPTHWATYQKGVEGWGNRLIRNQVKDITELQQNGPGLGFIDINYDKKTHGFLVRPKSQQEILEDINKTEGVEHRKARLDEYRNVSSGGLRLQYDIAREAARKINGTLKAYVNIAEANGRDPEEYIAEQLTHMGYAPAEGKNPIIDALRKGHGIAEEESPTGVNPKPTPGESIPLPPKRPPGREGPGFRVMGADEPTAPDIKTTKEQGEGFKRSKVNTIKHSAKNQGRFEDTAEKPTEEKVTMPSPEGAMYGPNKNIPEEKVLEHLRNAHELSVKEGDNKYVENMYKVLEEDWKVPRDVLFNLTQKVQRERNHEEPSEEEIKDALSKRKPTNPGIKRE